MIIIKMLRCGIFNSAASILENPSKHKGKKKTMLEKMSRHARKNCMKTNNKVKLIKSLLLISSSPPPPHPI